ncbi:MAG: helix-hairpin-helix domain-containing protein [Deltaproteobacteria bacterium]|nr:helix-hairpin-helix domain-containing protein [Deltaproteobacteria bacterium]
MHHSHPTTRRPAPPVALLAAFLLALFAASAAAPAAHAAAAESGVTVNVNTATADELMAIPGIGQAKASAIVAHRDANGPFTSPEDLLQVKGVGEALLAKIRPYVTTGGTTSAR